MITSAIELPSIDSMRAMKTVELRKLASQAGLKGQSSARKEQLLSLLERLQLAQEEAKAAASKPAKTRKICIVCEKRSPATAAQRKVHGVPGNDICVPCYTESGWENSHSDFAHDEILAIDETERTDAQKAEINGCWICFPELNQASADYVAKAGSSKAGMEIVAKGDKAEIFKAAAEAAEYRVSIETTKEGRTVATATHADGTWIQLAWNGRAYDYPNSSAKFAGKERKVRNLKEALRFLEK